MSVITFVDSGVLIAASRATHRGSLLALRLLDDSNRAFASSDFVRLEVLPKAIHHKRYAEIAFYETYFQSVRHWADSSSIVPLAFDEAARFGLNGFDALHIAAALATQATEFVTTEHVDKPIHRVTHFRIIALA